MTPVSGHEPGCCIRGANQTRIPNDINKLSIQHNYVKCQRVPCHKSTCISCYCAVSIHCIHCVHCIHEIHFLCDLKTNMLPPRLRNVHDNGFVWPLFHLLNEEVPLQHESAAETNSTPATLRPQLQLTSVLKIRIYAQFGSDHTQRTKLIFCLKYL